MCGIFGFTIFDFNKIKSKTFKETLNDLFVFSETRGREASGFALRCNKEIFIHKAPVTASKLIQSKEYQRYLNKCLCSSTDVPKPCSFIGHSRLATNGLQGIHSNNQPVCRNGIVGVHNGIIANVDSLWEQEHSVSRESEIDTELLVALLADSLGNQVSLQDSLASIYTKIEGAANLAFLFDSMPILSLSTNVGSLYYAWVNDKSGFIFASERYILEQLKRKTGLSLSEITHVEPGNALSLNLEDTTLSSFSYQNIAAPQEVPICITKDFSKIIDSNYQKEEMRSALRRCSKCILPETMPFIEFDNEGVCNYCQSYASPALKGKDQLRKDIQSQYKAGQHADCIAAFSGGRDSSYALHYLKQELGIQPIAYSYDWGMLTDLARRNQARMTGKLGIEHILISADIGKKRRNIRKNLEAWLKKPHLGMIPLLMAGDKHFYYYANMLQKQTGIATSIWSGNPFERTQFKVGFCNLDQNNSKKNVRIAAISNMMKMRLSFFYTSQFLFNPSYINTSLFDTISAFLSYYVIKKDYLHLFDYIPWEEDTVDDILLNEYNWETASDTKTTWRIGDGTAAFYNYVYYQIAGFSENDTFRSNQIREGHLSREEGLRLTIRDNTPRYDSIKEYLGLINVDMNEALRVVAGMPTLYGYPDNL